MKTIIIILLIISPISAFSELHSTESWTSRYLSPCPKQPTNRVCFTKTKRNFKRMLKYKGMILEYLAKYNLPGWLATIPFIESEYTERAISKSGAIGLWQIMPRNIQFYNTKTRIAFQTIIITKPTIARAKKIGRGPKKSTEIACKMLSHLYSKYGKDSHETVVRAYNAGETRIDKALKGIGKPLKDETINYYHQLLSLQVLLNDITTDNIYKLR